MKKLKATITYTKIYDYDEEFFGSSADDINKTISIDLYNYRTSDMLRKSFLEDVQPEVKVELIEQ